MMFGEKFYLDLLELMPKVSISVTKQFQFLINHKKYFVSTFYSSTISTTGKN